MSHQNQLIPQAYISNFHNRLTNEDDGIPIFTMAQQTRQHKRAKVVNYAEYDNDLFDEFNMNGSNFNNADTHYKDNAVSHENTPALTNGVTMDGSEYNVLENMNGADSIISNNKYDAGSNMVVESLSGLNSNNNASNGPSNKAQAQDIGNAVLPDLQDQHHNPFNILRYPKIRDTFINGKVVSPYRLNTDQETKANANSGEAIMIPITLDIEHMGHTIKDQFLWNYNDDSISPEEFASIYCKDLDMTSATLQTQIANIIKEQLKDLENIAATEIMSDLHVIINLTCNLQDRFFEDNFQWNLNDKSLTPERFATSIVQDLGLTREFIPLISQSLHETILKIKKDWVDGHLIQDHVPNDAAFGYLSGIRLDIDELGSNWCPRVEILTKEEIQKREIEKERNLRRLKRETDRLSRRGRRRLDDLETTMRM
ncbi:AQG_2a_G0038380.mRNA.1.CDS.1 [Saccharomyces cerevisiae]|uniref:Chromatin structure-remodeling complex subunit SFH1 n=6 Tax=Saccharomyces TaxID=4930 RepID=SFH1_YEAST|nr:Sfh1p [Saccharomyces cerevisiae S288C]Q06168.1 RecName: Full=Chromatin structure-remodeling complex subunit SFH1; AltName: Full=RSC complex subunit SFH1; AltName: Full=SNF5 homolog 1 [Saccharomyces cerevisiae S288C]6K15_G Chain G, Chromatin structure-remodeling complex subunit SFH1 [Saccharomyces cerevisiae S288C]6KW3_G Chain G, Chromatin structure-remodeling complex subunit SFH1 [Saccharomyces cerevisiae S288C]6KW4_G Chain G, Chromatin structure-remodeling complex subunit SFH1 [Saccharomyce|eukprot:NP_013425.1 Sfh1p [Saccharomyces cerevisiae S288C]